jgi:hypothetical protein
MTGAVEGMDSSLFEWRLCLLRGNAGFFPFHFEHVQTFWAEIPPMNRPHRPAMHSPAPSPGNPVHHKRILTSRNCKQFYGQEIWQRARNPPHHFGVCQPSCGNLRRGREGAPNPPAGRNLLPAFMDTCPTRQQRILGRNSVPGNCPSRARPRHAPRPPASSTLSR